MGNKMKKTIFISSTFEDLQDHRREVWKLLEEFDVDVKGMEKFGARKDTPIDTCLKEVELSDIYVGIIACRLGSIEEKSKKSITRLEYEKASELDKEIKIYMIDEKNALIQPIYVDRGKEYKKLEEFKEKLNDERTVETFINKEDLVKKLRRDLKNHFTLKKDTSEYILDEFEKSSIILKKFLLAPLSFSGNQIKLKIRIEGESFPASKEICDAFNFKFGATIGVAIKIAIPRGFEGVGINELYMSPKQHDDLIPFINLKEIEIYGRLQFSEKKIVESSARFKSETKTFQCIFAPKIFPRIKHYEPDGKIILILSKIAEIE